MCETRLTNSEARWKENTKEVNLNHLNIILIEYEEDFHFPLDIKYKRYAI